MRPEDLGQCSPEPGFLEAVRIGLTTCSRDGPVRVVVVEFYLVSADNRVRAAEYRVADSLRPLQ
jgi:hypothetical protein